jgi:hypothetical protein
MRLPVCAEAAIGAAAANASIATQTRRYLGMPRPTMAFSSRQSRQFHAEFAGAKDRHAVDQPLYRLAFHHNVPSELLLIAA